MHNSKKNRMRRIKKARMKMRERCETRLVVHRTPRHMYAQIIDSEGVKVSASTLDVSFQGQPSGNREAAGKVGALIAERAQTAGFERVAFDRAGFKYHGRVQALAEAARAGGLKF